MRIDGHSFVPFVRPQRASGPMDAFVRDKTYEILEGNRVQVGPWTFTTPSKCTGEGDSHLDYGGKQWLWDSAAHCMILARTEPEVARRELEAVFAHQREDGFVPHMNYFHGDGQEVPEWARAYGLTTYWSSPYHSDLTQPPILAMAALDVARAGQPVPLDKLCKYYDYLHEKRADGDGLLRILHPWESGWDNSQRWDKAIGLGEDKSRAAIDRCKMRLFCLGKEAGWDPDKMPDFNVKPVDFNVLYVKNLECMYELTREPRFQERADRARQAIFEKMWDGDKYVDLIDGEQSQVKSAAMFYPLLLDGEPHGRELIHDHLANPREFNTPGGYSVPTTSLDDPTFRGGEYWRGNIWGIVNFFTYCGVEKYLERQDDPVAAQMRDKLRWSVCDALYRLDFFEYFHPRGGEGHGVPSFGWNGLAVLMKDKPAFMWI